MEAHFRWCGVSTFESGPVNELIAQFDRALATTQAQVLAILRGAGASEPEVDAAAAAFAPVLNLVRGQANPTPEAIEREYIERGHRPLRKLAIVGGCGRRTDQEYAGAHDLHPHVPEIP